MTNAEHPYMKKWWVPGCTIGYEHTFVHTVADYLQGIETGKPAQPDFRSGLRTQKVCDAVIASAASGQVGRHPVGAASGRLPAFAAVGPVTHRMNYFGHGIDTSTTRYFLAGRRFPIGWVSSIDVCEPARDWPGPGRRMPIRTWRRWPPASCDTTRTTTGFTARGRLPS